jgi:hypothetical protein
MNGKHSSNHGQRNAGNGLEGKPDVIQKSETKSPINKVAEAYLQQLLKDGLRHVPVVPIERKSTVGFEVVESQESAAEYLKLVTAKCLQKSDPQTDSERLEVEESMVVLVTGKARVFCGYLKHRPVFGFDFQFALEMTGEEADRVQKELSTLGYHTERRPSLARKAPAF